MIRTQAQVTEIAADKMQTAQRFAGFSPLNAELLAGAEFRRADITFEKEHVLDLGGVRVRIIAVGYNHTAGDTVFAVEPDRILFSGDVVMTALPNVGASKSSQWLASMDLFDSLRPTRIVPSHGPMGDLSMVAAYRTFLTTVRTRTAELKKQGKTLAEAEQTLTAELGPKYPTAGGRLTGTIRAIYNEN